MKTINTIIVDNQKMFVEGLRSLIKNQRPQINLLSIADSAEALKILLSSHKPDIIFLELNLPDQDGLSLIPQLKNDYPELRICVLSSYAGTKFVKQAFQAGADGFLGKHNDFEEFNRAIDEVLDGQTFLAKGLRITPASNGFGPSAKITRKPATYEDRFLIKRKLTNREQEVLELIAEAKNNKEIAEELYISDQTVGVHRKNIMRKLGVRNTITLIKFAMEHQLV